MCISCHSLLLCVCLYHLNYIDSLLYTPLFLFFADSYRIVIGQWRIRFLVACAAISYFKGLCSVFRYFLEPWENNHNDRLFLIWINTSNFVERKIFFYLKKFVLPSTLLPLAICHYYTRRPNWGIYHFVRLAFVLSIGIIHCPLVLVIVTQTFPPLYRVQFLVVKNFL